MTLYFTVMARVISRHKNASVFPFRKGSTKSSLEIAACRSHVKNLLHFHGISVLEVHGIDPILPGVHVALIIIIKAQLQNDVQCQQHPNMKVDRKIAQARWSCSSEIPLITSAPFWCHKHGTSTEHGQRGCGSSQFCRKFG